MSKKLWKNYVKIGIFFVIAIISAVFLILAQQYDYPPIKSIRASCELSENWILTIEGKKEKKIIDLPYSTKENTAENLITIENRLPETNFSDGYLRLGSLQQEIRVYLDGEKIDTFETSILPFEDCCTIFVAKHPVTKPNINIIRRSEENLAEKIDELFETAINTVETIVVKP